MAEEDDLGEHTSTSGTNGVLRGLESATREADLESAICRFDFSKGTAETLGFSDSHRIVQFVPAGDNNEDYTVAFLSKHIQEKLWDVR